MTSSPTCLLPGSRLRFAATLMLALASAMTMAGVATPAMVSALEAAATSGWM